VGLIGQQRPGEKVACDDPSVRPSGHGSAAPHEKVGQQFRDFLRANA
jgi:hypothetical protein